MARADIHFRPQFHPLERERKPAHIVNISASDLFADLNRFEESQGLPRTDFSTLTWLHDLERTRRARQISLPGSALDEHPFSRNDVMKLGRFPSYDQLLTPRARKRIEKIYRVDFEAYDGNL